MTLTQNRLSTSKRLALEREPGKPRVDVEMKTDVSGPARKASPQFKPRKAEAQRSYQEDKRRKAVLAAHAAVPLARIDEMKNGR